jgi:hypothetical protein
MRPTPGKDGVPHSMQQPWCSRAAGAVFSSRSLKLARLHLVFSNLWRWRSAVINAARSFHRHRDPLLAYAAPNADPKNMAGSTYRPLASC